MCQMSPCLQLLSCVPESCVIWGNSVATCRGPTASRLCPTIPLPTSAVVPQELVAGGGKGWLATMWEASGFYLGSVFSTDVV